MVTVIILAMVAGFLAMRLYMVLGKRTGHEQPLPKPNDERLAAPIVARPAIDMPTEPRESINRLVESKAEAGVRAISSADLSFDASTFIDGARHAYRMVLEAYWKGDDETLAWLTEDEVRTAFTDAIAARAEAGHVLDNRLVSIERAIITDASLEGRNARITVNFDADISAVTRDADGNVVSGSLTDAVTTQDIWTFARTLRSDDPNWKLAETDEA